MNSNQSPLMGGEDRPIGLSVLRMYLGWYDREEITLSRFCELLNEECKKKEDNVASPSNSGDASVVSHPSTDNTPLTPETLKSLGFKKKKDGDGYWFELKYKNCVFITNDNYWSEKEWHIGFADLAYTSESTFLRHCTTVGQFKRLFLVLTNNELDAQSSVATGDATENKEPVTKESQCLHLAMREGKNNTLYCTSCGTTISTESPDNTPPPVESTSGSGGPIGKIKFEEMFRFDSQRQWVNKAQSWFGQWGEYKGQWICLDRKGNLCFIGEDFRVAEENDLYPITVYRIIRTTEANRK